MKKSLSLIAVFLVFALDAGAREREFIARSGLVMRLRPDTLAPRICVLPHGTQVTLLEERGAPLTIGAMTGRWSRVSWQGRTGWVFGGFLGGSSPGTIPAEIRGTWIKRFASPGTWFRFRFERDTLHVWEVMGVASMEEAWKLKSSRRQGDGWLLVFTGRAKSMYRTTGTVRITVTMLPGALRIGYDRPGFRSFRHVFSAE